LEFKILKLVVIVVQDWRMLKGMMNVTEDGLSTAMHLMLVMGDGSAVGREERAKFLRDLKLTQSAEVQSRSVIAAWTMYTEPSHSGARIATPVCRGWPWESHMPAS
jgi:hypothetical protein